MRLLMAAIALTAVASAADARPVASPAPLRQAGMLTCSFDPSVGLVLGSARGARCTFEKTGRRPFVESYAGRMSRVGFDVGLVGPQTITWRVLTPGGRIRPGTMGGVYGGPSAEATLLVGPGTHVLFNEVGERIALEPMTLSGQAGLNFAIGAGGLELSRDAYTSLR